MRPTTAVRITLVVMASIAMIGAVDAGFGGVWDHFALFCALVTMIIALLVGSSVRRPLVPIRADLYRWLAARAATTGERTEHLTDRAIGAYRAGLVGDDGRQLDDEH